MIAVEVLLIVLCGLAQLVFGGGYREGQTILDIYKSAGVSGLGGGVIGGVLVMVLHTAVGTIRGLCGPSRIYDHLAGVHHGKILRVRC